MVTRPGILKAQIQGMEVHSPSVCKPYVCIAMCTPGWLGGLQAMPGARGKATLTLVGMLGPVGRDVQQGPQGSEGAGAKTARVCGAVSAAAEMGRVLTCGPGKGAAAGPARSPCSVDTARTAAERPGSAPSAMAPPGPLAGAHLRTRSWWGPPGSQPQTRGDGAAGGVEIKAGSSCGQPHHGGGRRSRGRDPGVWSLTWPSGGPEVSGGPCSQAAGSKSRAVAQ